MIVRGIKNNKPIFQEQMDVIPRIGEEIRVNTDNKTYVVERVIWSINKYADLNYVILHVKEDYE